MSIELNDNAICGDFFTLKEDGNPADEQQFLHGLTLLADQTLKVLSHPIEIERAFTSIEKVKTSDLNTSDVGNNILQRLKEVFQKWVKVNLGDQCRHIPRERLAQACGEKFKIQFTCKMKEEWDKTVNLSLPEGISPQEISQSLCEAFLIYLQTGEISDQALEEDVLTLLSLADQHRIEGLIIKCAAIVEANLELHNLKVVLDFIENRHLPRFKMACLDYMYDQIEEIPLELKSTYHEELSLLLEMLKHGMEYSISSNGKVEVQIDSFSNNTIELLEKFNKLIPIQSLILAENHKGLQITFLNEIAPKLYGLDELIVTDASIDENVLAELKILFPKLNSFGNDALFLNSFDEVRNYIENFRNPGVSEQNLEKLHLRSLNLEAIPNLTDKQFDELTSYLKDIYHLFIKSDQITKVIAPQATWIYCIDCTSLTTLEASQAKKIYCINCPILESFVAHNAVKTICYKCTSLTSIIADKSTRIFCTDCSSLLTLEANQAKEIDCSNCTLLTNLEVKNAEQITCYGCKALTTIKAPQAKRIVCSYCTNLTYLEVEQAEEIVCFHCTKLKTLEANQAIKIDCSNCTNLTTLEARKAEDINCLNCKSLITLKVHYATEIDCRLCTRLKPLMLPKAKELFK